MLCNELRLNWTLCTDYICILRICLQIFCLRHKHTWYIHSLAYSKELAVLITSRQWALSEALHNAKFSPRFNCFRLFSTIRSQEVVGWPGHHFLCGGGLWKAAATTLWCSSLGEAWANWSTATICTSLSPTKAWYMKSIIIHGACNITLPPPTIVLQCLVQLGISENVSNQWLNSYWSRVVTVTDSWCSTLWLKPFSFHYCQ